MSSELKKKDAFLSFKIDNEVFAVTVHKVLEVLQKQEITIVPKAMEYVVGVINFRGEILPVIETREKFNMPKRESDIYVIIVLELEIDDEEVILGAVADSVRDVLEILPDEIKQVPKMGSTYNADFIKGMIRRDEQFIMLINIDKVFSVDDVELVKNIGSDEDLFENLNKSEV